MAEPMFSFSVRQYGDLMSKYKGALGPQGGLGDWRPELRTFMRVLGSQVEENFATASSAGKAWAPPSDVSRQTRVFNSSAPALTDSGVVRIGGRNSMWRRHRKQQQIHGLRQAASNAIEGAHSQYSALRIGWTTGQIGVKGGPNGIPWSGFLRHGGSIRRGGKVFHVPARDYLAMPKWVYNYWYELVEQGLEQRMLGYKSYRGEFHGVGGSYR